MPKKSAKSTPKKTQEAAPVQPPPAPEPVIEAAPEVEVKPEDEVSAAFTSLLAQVQQQQQALTALKAQVRTVEKHALRELKAALKAARKGKRKGAARKPSGFVKPTLISQQLATFLGKPEGTQMARTEVTKEINAYIRQHNLQDPKNGRHILPNQALKRLLSLGKTDELTYFNLQKFMSPHFAKATPAEAQ